MENTAMGKWGGGWWWGAISIYARGVCKAKMAHTAQTGQ